MGLTLHLNCLGEIVEGNYYRGYCLLSEDPDEPGALFLVVYAEPDRASELC